MSGIQSGENSIDQIGISETQSHEKKSLERTQSEQDSSGNPSPGATHERAQERRKGHHVISTETYYRVERRGSGAFRSGSYVLVDGGTDTEDGVFDE